MSKPEKSVFIDEEMVDPFSVDKKDFLVKAEHLERYQFAANYLLALAERPKVVYDIACGNGYGSQVLAEAGFTVVGLDRHQGFISEAGDRCAGLSAQFEITDLETAKNFPPHLPKPNAIISFETLEHLEHPDNALRLCFDALDDHECLISSIPNAVFEPKTEEGKPKNRFHKGLYFRDDAARLIEEAGFHISDIYGQPFPNIIVNHARFMSKPLDRIAFIGQGVFKTLAKVIAYPTKHILGQTYSHIFIAQKRK